MWLTSVDSSLGQIRSCALYGRKYEYLGVKPPKFLDGHTCAPFNMKIGRKLQGSTVPRTTLIHYVRRSFRDVNVDLWFHLVSFGIRVPTFCLFPGPMSWFPRLGMLETPLEYGPRDVRHGDPWVVPRTAMWTASPMKQFCARLKWVWQPCLAYQLIDMDLGSCSQIRIYWVKRVDYQACLSNGQ